MTVDEFLKKWCYNGHDELDCPKREDLLALLKAAEARWAAEVEGLVFSFDCRAVDCSGCCAKTKQLVKLALGRRG